MRFEEIHGRWQQGRLSQAEAAEVLGMGERTFRRWRDRYDEEGLGGLLDRRLGRASARRAPNDEVYRVLELYRSRYTGFTTKHFHDKLRQRDGFGLGYTWAKLRLQDAGLITKRPGARCTARSAPGGRLPACSCIRTGRRTAGCRRSIRNST